MHIEIISFTDRGYALARTIAGRLEHHHAEAVPRGTKPGVICSQAFSDREALVFIGAVGIAVRSVAPYVKDKLTDPPVIVIDEAGRYVIPVLSGHVGGANDLAVEIADNIGAEPVLTTATDVSGAFSVDLFAEENGLRIMNRDGIARVSSIGRPGKLPVLSQSQITFFLFIVSSFQYILFVPHIFITEEGQYLYNIVFFNHTAINYQMRHLDNACVLT